MCCENQDRGLEAGVKGGLMEEVMTKPGKGVADKRPAQRREHVWYV